MGSKERAQWEADMNSEREDAAKPAEGDASTTSESYQQQEDVGGASHAASHAAARPSSGVVVNGRGSSNSVDGSLPRLSRLLAAVQRQSGEVRRMKEESLNQLLALTQAQQATQHRSDRAHEHSAVGQCFHTLRLSARCSCPCGRCTLFCLISSQLSNSLSQQTQHLAEAQQVHNTHSASSVRGAVQRAAAVGSHRDNVLRFCFADLPLCCCLLCISALPRWRPHCRAVSPRWLLAMPSSPNCDRFCRA